MSVPQPTTRALFRDEVFAQFHQRLHGDLLRVQAAGPWWPTALVALACCALMAFLCVARYTRTAEVTGTLVPRAGLLRLTSPQGGVVLERRVAEGVRVSGGAVLFTVSAERSSVARGNAEEQIAASMRARRASLESELQQLARRARQRDSELQRSRRQWQQELGHGEAEQALQAQRIQLAGTLVERYAQLQARGFVPASQVQQYQADLLEQRQHLADLLRSAAALQHSQRDSEQQQRELRWQDERAAAALRRELALLDEGGADVEARRIWQVRAPRDGVVSAILVDSGQSIAAGQPLAALVPGQSPLEAELLAPSRAIGFLRAGQRVRLRYPAFPYQKFGLQPGRVRELSAATLPVDGAAEPLYRVRVTLESQQVAAYGRPQALLPGAAVEASVLLDRRRLIEWLIEPLLGLKGRG